MSSSSLATAVAHAAAESNKSLMSAVPDAEKDRLARCAVCGNDCEAPLEVRLGGRVAIFDCFECAIHLMAPACERCRCRIIGHGVEAAGAIYCCAHCARVAQRP
jgi:hypothetical protein